MSDRFERLTAVFLCGEAGITPVVIDTQAAYVSGWLGSIRSNAKLLI